MNQILIKIFVMLMTMLCMCGCRAESETVLLSMDEEVSEQADEGLSAIDESKEPDEQDNRASADKTYAQRETDGEQISASSECYVHVCGAVRYPGVYKLESGARIYEAIAKAGGVTEDAYADGVNQAVPVSDGDMIRIPTVEEWENGLFEETNPSAVSQTDNNAPEDTYDDGLVDINTADVSELCSLPGIGETRAEAIIAYRLEHGEFHAIEDIQNVSGIKQGLYSKIKDKIKI